MSEIKVDALTGKTSAGNITVTVGATATQSLHDGVLKAWVGADTAAVQQQSLNFSSSSDNGTGSYTHTLTNAASQDLKDSGLQVSAGGGTRFARYASGATTTTVVDFRIHNTSGGAVDGDHNINFAGGLA
jgi:hypothetical protein